MAEQKWTLRIIWKDGKETFVSPYICCKDLFAKKYHEYPWGDCRMQFFHLDNKITLNLNAAEEMHLEECHEDERIYQMDLQNRWISAVKKILHEANQEMERLLNEDK